VAGSKHELNHFFLNFCGMTVIEAPDGSLYLAGAGRLQKLRADGSTDSSFAPPELSLYHGFLGPTIFSIALDTGGRLLVCGMFDLVDHTQQATGLLRLLPNGAVLRFRQWGGAA
jgi:hypothetical protein